MSLPNGMIDLTPYKMIIRNDIFDIAKKWFKRYGSVQIETPVMELFSSVTQMYGEDFDKGVFLIENTDELNECDQKLFLRYDLTLPLARYVGMNGLRTLRRHQIGKVYRKDTAQVQKGRFREFYQCDFDIVGNDGESCTFDIEMISVIQSIMSELLGSNTYIMKINFKGLVTSMLNWCNIDALLHSTVCSTLDKMDKKHISEIMLELETKLNQDQCEKIRLLIDSYKLNGFQPIIEIIKFDFNKFQLIMSYLAQRGYSNVEFDPFLMRGMDYYTGILFECTYNDKNIMPFSICGGGRYDKMIGKFSNMGDIKAIGMSLGIERIAHILEHTLHKSDKNECNTYDIYVGTVGKYSQDVFLYKQNICDMLRSRGLCVLAMHLTTQSMRQQMETVFTNNIKIMVVIGNDEFMNNTITVKYIDDKRQVNLNVDEAINNIVDYVKHISTL
jgi:histidyl-tRNA synthetase